MRIRHFLFLLIPAVIQGCMAYYTEEDSSGVVKTPQERGEVAVQKYIQDNMKGENTYKSYSFGAIDTIVPKEIEYLGQLKESRLQLRATRDQYEKNDPLFLRSDSLLRAADTLIARQEKLISEKHIRNFFRLKHIFVLSGEKDHKVYECRFYLSSNFFVKDVHVLMEMKLDEVNYDWFNYYMKQLSLFINEDEYAAGQKSAEIYDFFNERMENYEGDKSELLRSILVAVRLTRKFNAFDPEMITKGVIIEDYYHVEGYKPLEFSKVQAIVSSVGEKDSLLGYSVFHKFNSIIDEKDSLQCYYFELDPWFVIAGRLPVQPPYDKYFLN